MSCVYHVAKNGCDRNPGTAEKPFLTIGRAAQLAAAGDTVIVHAGEYREWVDPQNGGLSDSCRITYQAAEGEHVVIKGSEIITDWEKDGCVWKKTLPNTFFGEWNPYALPVGGDWLISPTDPHVHLGDVYLNGVSMYEATSLEAVRKAEKRISGHQLPWSDHVELIPDPEQTVYQWYAQVDDETTTLYVNFQDADPNAQLVEINVRPYCFYPTKTGLNYLTVRGFEMAQAACPWTPPTADQPGMLGTHWSKGWIIENNHLHDAKCSAISLGKEASTGHNLYSRYGRKPGYQYQMESVFLGLQGGWCREKIGSHIVRNNLIHDCGQNGVVGHMGGAFCRIEHNHIYNIGVKREFFGYEIGGIKLHAAVDTQILRNNIHHCELGIWMDWQAQGVRIHGNVFHHNDRDLMIEVTHGPCLVDHNILASAYSLDDMAQGTAFVNNLMRGYICNRAVLDRATPYHFPHTTQVAGCAVVYGGDDRFVNNLFTGEFTPGSDEPHVGTCAYDRYTSPAEYAGLLDAEGNTDEAKYYVVSQPVYTAGNAYAGMAKPFTKEADAHLCAQSVTADVVCEGGECYLHINVPAGLASMAHTPVSTATLGMPRITEEPYENPDGSAIGFGCDMTGAPWGETAVPGPLSTLREGDNRVLVWKA